MKIFRSKWLSVVIIAGISWLGFSFIKIKLQENLVNKEVRGLEAKINDLESDNSYMEKIISYLKNPSFLQKEARLKLNYKAFEEKVAFVYPDESAKAGSASNDFNKQLAQMPNYVKWWYYLLGY
ncbi:MAG: hypothetical protein Q8R55_05865 [Candidatus Taylorbacteria bacterium]|nr:hypothetical protein [Candidatus Taylorbacteria bacterium]